MSIYFLVSFTYPRIIYMSHVYGDSRVVLATAWSVNGCKNSDASLSSHLADISGESHSILSTRESSYAITHVHDWRVTCFLIFQARAHAHAFAYG